MPPPLSSSISAAAAAARARPRVLLSVVALPAAARARARVLLSVVAPPAAGRLASFSTTTTTTTGMAGTEETKAAAPPQKQQQQGGGGGVVSERIMPHLLNIYGSCATARDFEIYAPHATFEDPLMRAHGVKQIKSAFYTLPKVFGESKIAEYTIQENATGPGKVEIVIDNKQHYKFLGKGVDVASLITLDVEDGKVVKHEDWWDKKPLKSRETVGLPLVGRVAEASRRGAMLLTHALMAFGKDPSS